MTAADSNTPEDSQPSTPAFAESQIVRDGGSVGGNQLSRIVAIWPMLSDDQRAAVANHAVGLEAINAPRREGSTR